MFKILNVLNIIMYWHTLSHVQDFSVLYNVLPFYTFSAYKLIIYTYNHRITHMLLDTCDPPPSSSLLLRNVLKVPKVTNKVPIITNDELFLQYYLMSWHVNLTKLIHTQVHAHTHLYIINMVLKNWFDFTW